jgi:hypothetical protein
VSLKDFPIDLQIIGEVGREVREAVVAGNARLEPAV